MLRDDIVTFGIPLISRAAAKDWPTIERLFNRDAGIALQSNRSEFSHHRGLERTPVGHRSRRSPARVHRSPAPAAANLFRGLRR